MYRSASHTGDAVIRGMYSSVSVGVVHVLCACAQVQSTVWCSCHTAACNHLTTHFLSRLLVRLVVVVVVVAAAVVVQLIFAFLWTPKNRQLVAFSHIFETRGEKNIVNTDVFCASQAQKNTVFTRWCAFGSKNHGIYSVFVPAPSKALVFTHFSPRCKMKFLHAKRTQTLHLTIFLHPERSQKKNVKKLLKNSPKSTSKSIL